MIFSDKTKYFANTWKYIRKSFIYKKKILTLLLPVFSAIVNIRQYLTFILGWNRSRGVCAGGCSECHPFCIKTVISQLKRNNFDKE